MGRDLQEMRGIKMDENKKIESSCEAIFGRRRQSRHANNATVACQD